MKVKKEIDKNISKDNNIKKNKEINKENEKFISMEIDSIDKKVNEEETKEINKIQNNESNKQISDKEVIITSNANNIIDKDYEKNNEIINKKNNKIIEISKGIEVNKTLSKEVNNVVDSKEEKNVPIYQLISFPKHITMNISTSKASDNESNNQSLNMEESYDNSEIINPYFITEGFKFENYTKGTIVNDSSDKIMINCGYFPIDAFQKRNKS